MTVMLINVSIGADSYASQGPDTGHYQFHICSVQHIEDTNQILRTQVQLFYTLFSAYFFVSHFKIYYMHQPKLSIVTDYEKLFASKLL
jgi:hypothetical protein